MADEQRPGPLVVDAGDHSRDIAPDKDDVQLRLAAWLATVSAEAGPEAPVAATDDEPDQGWLH